MMKVRRYYAIFAVAVIAVIVGISLPLSLITIEIAGDKTNLGLLSTILMAIYLSAGLRIVDAQEKAALLLFGKPLFEAMPGLVLVPLGICELRKETGLDIQEELPADPEKLYLGDEPTVPKGLYVPIRVIFPEFVKGKNILPQDIMATINGKAKLLDEPDNEDDPLNKRITAQVVPIVRFNISNYSEFLVRIGSVTEAKRQLQDAAVTIFNRDLTRVSVATALKNLTLLNARLKVEMGEVTKDWGIKFLNAEIKSILFTHDLNKSISGVVEAKYNARATRQNERAPLEGRAEGLRKMVDMLGIDPVVIIGAETARAVTNNPGQKTIIAGSAGFADLAAGIVGLSQSTKEK